MGNAESLEECTEPIETADASDELSVTTKPFDLSLLLDSAKLQQSLGTSSEPLEDEVSRHRDQLLSWLRGLLRANESTISSLQFVEEAVGFGVARHNATEFFNSVDRYGNGQLQCSSLISALQDSSARSILHACSPCTIAPGAVDIYSDGGANAGIGVKLMQFLQRNRVASDLLNLPGYEASLTQFTLREKLVHSRFVNWKNNDEDRDKASDEKGQQLMDIKKCFSKITVSSSERSIDNLLDNNPSTYWQSNGSPRRHWIRLHMLPGVMIKELAILVNQSDDSYMPKKVAVLVGNSEGNLRDLKEVEVPRNLTGKFVISKSIRSFRYVQVSIRGCHSDGCDTRVRGISVKGYKFVEEKKPLVLDSLVTWHLTMLASTALSSVQTAPALRETLIVQSSIAFKQLKPLVLSSSSAERPEFLSMFVVTKVSEFLRSLCLEGSKPLNTPAMEALLYFSVATGNMNDILHSMRLLQANPTQLVGVADLLHSLDEILLFKQRAHAEQLKLAVANCNGGHSEQAGNVLSNQLTTGTAYNSKSGKKDVLFTFKDKDDRHFVVYKLIAKVPSGDNGAKEGYVFTASSADQVQHLESLDLKDESLKPPGHFCIDPETHMAEVTMTTVKADKLLVIRFLSSESADHVSIHCVQVFGYFLSEQELWYSDNVPLSSSLPVAGEPVASYDILANLLCLLIKLVQDRRVLWQRLAHNQMDTTLSVEPHVEVEQLSLQEVWLLYQQLIGQNEAIQCLQLLHCCLPFLEARRNPSNDENVIIATKVLKHLCSVVDKEVDRSNDVIEKMSHDVILDGIVVFFPDSSARRTHLISMLDCVMSEQLPASWWVKFESLCVHFSSQDPSALLGLRKVANDNNSEALVILKTIVTIVTRDALSMKRARCSDLVQLLGSLQATMFFWCQKDGEGNHTALINQYIIHLADNCLKVVQKILSHDDKLTALNFLQQSLLATVLPQLLYLLNSLKHISDVQQVAMRNLFPLVKAIYKLTASIPELSTGIESNGMESNQSDSIVDVKVIESSHNYNNNAVISEEFSFEEASQLTVEFDGRCSTETDCDVLTFTDAQGVTHRCHGKVGTDNWPKTLQFKGSKLTFSFHSDSTNTDWGYRFCIKVYSKLKKSFHWLFDLQLSLSRLLGQLCSSALSEIVVANDNKSKQEKEEILVRSDVWKTLFRGGFQINKLTRSLSGAHSTMPSESHLNDYLMEMANGTSCSLLQQCQLGQQGAVPPQYGGAVVDKAVNAIFASLIWHCQELRDEVSEFVMATTVPPKLSPRLLKVYSIAQDMRRELVEARRKVMEENEVETSEDVNEDAPIIACHEKALFLLKFSGLTKVTGAHMQQVSPSSRSSWLRKSLQWRKMGSIDGKPKLSHQASIVEDDTKDTDPSIKMVLDFVKDDRITKDQVHSLLQYRFKRAKTISHVYTFCADFIQLFAPQIFQLSVIVFIQQLLSQQQSFPTHYAAKLDGCGLEKENEVRKAYYLFLTKVIDAVRSCRLQEGGSYPASYYLVKSYLLHLLDVDWQDYDNSFILEQELPELFLETAITSFKPTDKVDMFPMETELMDRYQLQSKLREKLLELKNFTKVMEHFKDFEPQKELHYFLVTAIHVVPNVIMVTCDGCGARINHQWYRSLESSENCDLCETCFNDGTGSRPDDHSSDHLFIRLGRFICDGCRMLISSHRYHSTTKDDYDLCLGCYRANGGLGDQWMYYPMTLLPKTDKRNAYYSINPEESEGMLLESNTLLKPGKLTNIRMYNHQHAFLLFSSLSLAISNKISKKSSTSNSEYRQSAINIHLNCLKLLTYCLRASLCGAEENTAMLKLKEKEEEAAKKAKEKNDDNSGNGNKVTIETADGEVTHKHDKKSSHEHDDKSSHEHEEKSSHKHDDKSSHEHEEKSSNEHDDKSSHEHDDKSSHEHDDKSSNEHDDKSSHEHDDKSSHEHEEKSSNEHDDKSSNEHDDKSSHEHDDKSSHEHDDKSSHEHDDKSSHEHDDKSSNQHDDKGSHEHDDKSSHEHDDKSSHEHDDKSSNEHDDKSSHEHDDKSSNEHDDKGSHEHDDKSSHEHDDKSSHEHDDKSSNEHDDKSSHEHDEKSSHELEGKSSHEHDDKSSHELEGKSSHEHEEKSLLDDARQTTLQSLHQVTSQDVQNNSNDESFGAAEKHFSFNSLEKILGLLACIIPNEASMSCWSSVSRTFLINRLLPVLLNISQCCHINPQQQLQAVLIVARYVSKLQPQDGDKVVTESCDGGTFSEDGVKLVQYFFGLGASYLRRSDFIGAAAIAEVLNILCEVVTWKKVVTIVISHCFEIPQKVELPSLFGLLVTAGFPHLLRVGCIVQVANSDDGKCVVTDVSPGKSVTVVNIMSRAVTVVPRKDLEISQSAMAGCANMSQLYDILQLLNNLKMRKNESSQAVELNWMISLLLKSIYIVLQQNTDNKADVIQAILDAKILPTIVRWASQPTQMSQKWLLSDLEVLSVHLYRPHGDSTVTVETKEMSQQPAISRSSSVIENDPLVGLPSDVKEIITNMQEAFNCSFAVLRAMYEMAEQDLAKWMELVQGSYDDGALQPSEEAIAKAKEWEPASVREVVQQIQDSANDNGVLMFTPITSDLKNMVANEESSSSLKVQLMTSSTATNTAAAAVSVAGSKKDSQQREREESHELLQAEMKKEYEGTNRDEVLKVNKALVVLHSRQLLASLLAQWQSSSIPLSCSLLGGINIMQLFCLLDLLVRSQSNGTSDKILHSLVSCGVTEELLQLSLTAAQCMGEVSVGNKYCNSKQSLEPTGENHVTIPNASSLSITFDTKCNIAGELVLASDEGFTKHLKTYKGSAPWNKYIIPGDTVYYKVTAGGSCDQWGFTVVGSQVGRFETGYMLLSNLLHQSQDGNKQVLPLKKLWPWLAAVTCQHTGCRRLQSVKLLMELLHMQQLPTSHASLAMANSTERVELAVLKPLWQLYTSMLKKHEDDSQQVDTPVPQIVRALTELFLLVENVAEDWGMAQDHLIDMLTTEGLNTWLEKGISNVALVSIALQLDNTASQQFLEAKRNYNPAKEMPKESNNDSGSSSNTTSSTSTSDDEDSFDDDDDYLYSDSS